MAARTISVEQRFELLARLGANVDWDSLDSSKIQVLIDKPGDPASEFTEFLRNGGRMKFELKDFPMWKTIKLGTGIKDAAGFRTAIGDAKMRIGDWANDILGMPAFKVSEVEQSIDLVLVTPKELGFKGNATYKDICAKAKELGLELCPNEVGLQLRLQYTDQPMNERVVVAMEPITGSDGDLDVFGVAHDDDGRWLHADRGDPGYVWFPADRFVFRRK